MRSAGTMSTDAFEVAAGLLVQNLTHVAYSFEPALAAAYNCSLGTMAVLVSAPLHLDNLTKSPSEPLLQVLALLILD